MSNLDKALHRRIVKNLHDSVLEEVVAMYSKNVDTAVMSLCAKYNVPVNFISGYIFNHNGTRYQGATNYLYYASGITKIATSPHLHTRKADFFSPEHEAFLKEHNDFLVILDMFKKDFNALNGYMRKVLVLAQNVTQLSQLVPNAFLKTVLKRVIDNMVTMMPSIASHYFFLSSDKLDEIVVNRFIDQNKAQANILDEIQTKTVLFGL